MIKSKSHEKLTDTNISQVVSLLEQDNPITKNNVLPKVGIFSK